ncbi:MAG: PAS domain-containing sensor histidine kinase [bacterium]|nr:PAS domain-containing sensor histidine kinase [bacterium]
MHISTPPNLGLIDGVPAHELLEGLGSLHQSVVVTNRDGTVLWASKGLAGLSGGSSESIDKPLASLCQRYLEAQRHTADPELISREVEAILERLEAHGRVCHQAVGARACESAAPGLEFNAFAVDSHDREGGPCQLGSGARLYVAILREAASHRARAHRPSGSSDFYQQILDQHPEATLAIDPSGFITYANARALRLLGKPLAELIDAPISLYFPSSAILPMNATLGADPDAAERAVVELAPSGQPAAFVEVASRRLERPDGTILGRVLQLRDTTQQQRMTERFKQKIASLESYAHTVSHDLRSPLVSLIGFTRLMKQDYATLLDETGRRFLDRIEQAGSNMNKMTQDLLELSTREPSTAKSREAVDPRNVLVQIQAEMKPRLEELAIRLVLPTAPPLIQCDRTQLYQVFSNLIGNAIQHMGRCEAPQIEVEIREEPDRRVIVVRDNGRGIDPGAHDKIFDAFHSVSREGGARSTGVGLAIVKKIALAHGGNVAVESEPGRGATFFVTLEHH